jgi:Mannosyltransferase putative
MSTDAEARADLAAVAQAPHPYPAQRFEGRGLVMCAGGARLLTCAWVAISVLRRQLGCTLPIELWYLGEKELGPVEASLFAHLGVETVDALEHRPLNPARRLGGWELKAYALANCRFREVVLLDADNVAVSDPARLFDSEEYAASGALFWPDVQRLSPTNAIWDLCQTPYRSEPAWESGQVVVDKARCWAALQVAWHMNDHSDVFYQLVHGDKETFHLAWRMLDQPYAMTPHRARSAGFGMFQHDFQGKVLFQHRCHAKWVLRGDNPRFNGFALEDECLGYVDELRDLWSGRIDAVPSRSPHDLDVEAGLVAARWFRYELVGSHDRTLELLSGNRIGVGRSRDALTWHVEGDELVLGGREGPSGRLHRINGDGWGGRLGSDRREVEMHPAPFHDQDPVALVITALAQRLAGEAGSLDGAEERDIVIAVAAVAALGDRDDLLDRELSRWTDRIGSLLGGGGVGVGAAVEAAERVTAALEEAKDRAAGRNPSLRGWAPPGYDPI